MENQKTLQTIAQEKVHPSPTTTGFLPSVTPVAAPPSTTPLGGEYDKISSLPANHILNVIKMLKEKQERASIWFDYNLPSNGKCGYPKEVKLREMTTLDEKILIKEMFSSKENSLLNVIKKCVKFEGLPDFNWELLTSFDQDFILLELSAITFPGEKDISITDEAGHKISMKLNKEDLTLNVVPEDLVYPFKVVIPSANITWYLSFITLKNQKDIDKATKSLSGDVLTSLLISIAHTTEKVEINGQALTFDNFYEVVKLLDSLSPSDLKVIIDFYNEKTVTAYGYSCRREYYCTECGKNGSVEVEPLNWFRISL